MLGTSDPTLESDFEGGKVGLLLGATDRISLTITEVLPEGDPLIELLSNAMGMISMVPQIVCRVNLDY